MVYFFAKLTQFSYQREFKLNFGKDLSGVKNRVPESMSAFERKIEDASEAETEVPIVEPSGMANTFQEQNLKKCDRKAGDSHEENKNSIPDIQILKIFFLILSVFFIKLSALIGILLNIVIYIKIFLSSHFSYLPHSIYIYQPNSKKYCSFRRI